MLDGKIDQSRLITHRLPAAQCQELMGIAASRRPEYVKGYLSWK
jgi:threonine dehydrogenase-like Zn-dependent dehydrogenase